MKGISVHTPFTRTIAALASRYRRSALRNARAPKEYSVTGTPVFVTLKTRRLQGIVEQQQFGGPGAMFRVRLQKPIPFDIFAIYTGTESYPGWNKLHAEYERMGFLKTVRPSKEEVESWMSMGRDPAYLHSKEFVTHMWAPWRFVTVQSARMKRGMPLEVVIEDRAHVSASTVFPVRFVKWVKTWHGRAPLVWFPEPLTWWDIQNVADWKLIRPSYISKHAYFIPFEQFKAVYKAGIKLPPARPRRIGGRKFMEFLEPVPLKKAVDMFLRPYYRHALKKGYGVGGPAAIWRALLGYVIYHMAPLDTNAVEAIRPMREDLFYGLVVPAEAAFEGL